MKLFLELKHYAEWFQESQDELREFYLKKRYKLWNIRRETQIQDWTTPDSRNTSSTTNLEEEEIVDAPGNDGNASMPEQVKRPNPW